MTTRRQHSGSPLKSLAFGKRLAKDKNSKKPTSKSVTSKPLKRKEVPPRTRKAKDFKPFITMSSWANDESDSELSPSYRKQKQQERLLQSKEATESTDPPKDPPSSPSTFLQQAGSKLHSIIDKTMGKWTFPTTNIAALDSHRAKLHSSQKGIKESLTTETKSTTILTPIDEGPPNLSSESQSFNQPSSNTPPDNQGAALSTDSASLSSLQSVSSAPIPLSQTETRYSKQSVQKGLTKDTKTLIPQEYSYEDNNIDGWGLADDEDSDEEDNTDQFSAGTRRATTTKQDDENTIGSGKTSIVRRRDMNKVVIPSYVRFQFMIPPESGEEEEDDDNPEYRENYDRIREILNTLVTQIRILDEKAEIISWRTKDNFSFLTKSSFPEDVASIAKFFKGFRKRMKASRRV